VRILLISIGPKHGRTKRREEEALADDYLRRTARYTGAHGLWVETEAALWSAAGSGSGRTPAKVILMEGGGSLLSSVEFAQAIGGFRDRGAQHVVVGIGGADGWSAATRERADLLVSLGRFTFPHSLARVVVAEQIYRAMTILAGHPYHCGH